MAHFVREAPVPAEVCVEYIQSRSGKTWADWEVELLSSWYLMADPALPGRAHFQALLRVVAARVRRGEDRHATLPLGATEGKSFAIAAGDVLAFSLPKRKHTYQPEETTFLEWLADAVYTHMRNYRGNEKKAEQRRREVPLESCSGVKLSQLHPALLPDPSSFLCPDPSCGSDHLTKREIEIARLLRAGRSIKDIASLLGIDHDTVTRHCRNAALRGQ
jgi:helix-turn-helix protein